MAPAFPTVSRRILLDLSEHTLLGATDAAEDYVANASIHLESSFQSLARQSGGFTRQAPTVEGDSTAEMVYLVRDVSVGERTTIKRLATLLKQGIEKGGNGYKVKIEYPEVGARPAMGEHDEVALLLIYPKDDKPDVENHFKTAAMSIGPVAQGASVGRFGLPDSQPSKKVVFVSAKDAPEKAQGWASTFLPPDLLRNGEAIMCSLVPTLIRHAVPIDDPFEIEPIWELPDYRYHRDKTILLADPTHGNELPSDPPEDEIERWARNVMNKQVGVASSGGGASAYRIIALLERLSDQHVPIDVFSGLSGGAVVGAYFVGDGFKGTDKVLERGDTLQVLMPTLFVTTKTLEWIIDEDLGYQRLGNTSRKFHSVTTDLRGDSRLPPRGCVVTKGTLGQAARVASALPVGFAPTTLAKHRFGDGMASAIVPTHVTIDHGADIVIACNCIPGPAHTNPFSGHWLGRLVYDKTPMGRVIDAWSWIDYLTQTASASEGFGSTAFFEFKPKNQASFEMFRWADSYKILDSARDEHERIDKLVAGVRKAWDSTPWSSR